MRRTILLSLIGLICAGGVASADRHNNRGHDHRWDERQPRSGGVVVRDHRDHRWSERERRVTPQRRVDYRRPVYINNGYYQFHNGSRYRYTRPVIHRRYFDYRIRPQIVVENYQPMTGYVWVPGQWQWNGYEWTWISGYYAVDPNYAEYDSY